MTTQTTSEQVLPETFEELIDEHITWVAEWDGALPADTFFGVWADFQSEKQPVELRARVVNGHLEFITASENRVRVADNHIYLQDGRELIVHLEPAT